MPVLGNKTTTGTLMLRRWKRACGGGKEDKKEEFCIAIMTTEMELWMSWG